MTITYRSGRGAGVPKTTQVFRSNGTWTRPSGCTTIRVQLCGGGGGGAGHSESGGAGGYSEETLDVTGIGSAGVSIGGGGGRVGYYGLAGNGGTTSFGSYLSATGGYGANRNSQHQGGEGGVGSGGGVNFYGGMGAGHSDIPGSAGLNFGSPSIFGGQHGRRHSTNTSTANEDNVGPGSGGTGSSGQSGATGGSVGSKGVVIVHEYYAS